jgi:hypothetical protein
LEVSGSHLYEELTIPDDVSVFLPQSFHMNAKAGHYHFIPGHFKLTEMLVLNVVVIVIIIIPFLTAYLVKHKENFTFF